MNIHEYQAKEIFAKWGLPVPQHLVCSTLDEVRDAYRKIAKEGKQCNHREPADGPMTAEILRESDE